MPKLEKIYFFGNVTMYNFRKTEACTAYWDTRYKKTCLKYCILCIYFSNLRHLLQRPYFNSQLWTYNAENSIQTLLERTWKIHVFEIFYFKYTKNKTTWNRSQNTA